MTSNLDELPGLLIELRELIRQAHAAIKDGNQLLKELRAISAEGAERARTAAERAAVTEMQRFQAHIQAEMDRHASDLNRSVSAARLQVIKALTVKKIAERPDGKGLEVSFTGNLFNAGPETEPA